MELPKKPFILYCNYQFRRGDIINDNIKVIRVYDRIWWNRLLKYFGWYKDTNKHKVKLI